MDGGYAYGRHKCVWHEMSCKSFWQHFKKKKGRSNKRSSSKRRCLTAKGQAGAGQGKEGRGRWEAAVISTLTSVFWEHLRSPSNWHPFGAWGRGRGRVNLAAASSKYLCLCFIYLHCQNQFCPRVQLFFTFMPRPLPTSLCNPLQRRPCAATVGDTHAKHGRKCCLFSIKNLSSTNARSKLIPGPFIESRQVLNRQLP